MLIPSPSVVYLLQLAHLTRPTGQLHATPPIQSGLPARRMPQSAAIHGHPGAPLAASLPRHPHASHPPSRPVSPRGASHHPISPGQLVNSLRQHGTHATLRGHRTPACLAPRRERRPVSRPRPTGAPAQRGRPSCVQTFCGPKVIRGGRPPAHRVLATVSRGQLVNGPLSRTRARTASLP